MPKQHSPSSPDSSSDTLVIRRTIPATAEFLFDAWTQPEKMKEWWGPGDVKCSAIEIDLRVDGRYRIANLFPDGKTVWITGEFESIEPPNKLVYTSRVEPNPGPLELVTVQFEPREG